MIARRGAAVAALSFFVGIGIAGCGSGIPLLVEPRVGDPGDVAFAGGGAATVPLGSISETGAGGATSMVAAARALAAPAGVAPFLRGGATVAPDVELSVRVTGRDLGLGGRWLALDERTEKGGALTLSLGAEATTAQMSGLAGDDYDGVTIHEAHVYGANVPVILGWQSDAGLVLAYVGAIVGLSHGSFEATNDGSDVVTPTSLSYFRWSTALTGGFGVGFRRVHVLAELGIERTGASLTAAGNSAGSLDGWVLHPGFALSIKL